MGMPEIVFRLQMFRGDWDQIWSQLRMLLLMEGLSHVNQTHLRQMDAFKKRGLIQLNYPLLYRSGIHYETEKGTEIWPDIPSLLAGTMGKGVYPGIFGDCEDLACYRIAEWRELPWHFERSRKWEHTSPETDGRDGSVEFGDPNFPQGAEEVAAKKAGKMWPGWKQVKGGVFAKPFAKWRRGPAGNFHYHALVLTGDGRLEDPSLVLGMGREAEYNEAGLVEKMKDPENAIKIQYAKKPDVMVIDPEKPSGYSGGKADQFDAQVLALLEKGAKVEELETSLGNLNDPETKAYLANPIPLSEGEFDVDAAIGWNRAEGRFSPKSDEQETRRLFGYRNH